jgi:hypothetical protein
MNSGTKMGEVRSTPGQITPPEAEQTATKHAPLLKLRLFGAIIVLVSLGFLYWSMFLPIAEAMRTGARGVVYVDLRAIWLLWIGIWVLAADLRDQNVGDVGPDGQLRWNRKGRIARYFFIGGYAIMIVVVYLYLRAIGLSPF